LDLSRRPTLDPRHQGPLAAFLEQCDLVKFAGWRPGAHELDGLEAAAIWVVDEASPAGPNVATVPEDGDGTEAPPPEAEPKGGTHAV